MNDYDDIFSFSSLYRAYKTCLKGKRHKREAIIFSLNLSQNLWSLYYDLKYHRYRIDGYHEFKIFDPKERMIQAISFKDRIVQHALVDGYLMPLLSKQFIYDNVACQKGKGTSFTHQRLRAFIHRYLGDRHGYFVQIDIHKYFDSIDHEILKDILKGIVTPPILFEFLCQIIDSYHPREGIGLPMGNQTSQCFALLYLSNIDHYFKEKCHVKFYLRYMDDIILYANNKHDAITLLHEAKTKVSSLKISLNPKSHVSSCSNGFEMIGWRYRFTRNRTIIRLRRSTWKRIKNKIKQDNLSQNSFASLLGFLQSNRAKYLNHKVKSLFVYV